MRPETHYADPSPRRSVTLSAVIGSRFDCNSALSALSMISNSILLNSCFSTIVLLTLTQRHDRNRNGRLKSRIALRGPALSCPRSALCASESDLRAFSAPPIPGSARPVSVPIVGRVIVISGGNRRRCVGRTWRHDNNGRSCRGRSRVIVERSRSGVVVCRSRVIVERGRSGVAVAIRCVAVTGVNHLGRRGACSKR